MCANFLGHPVRAQWENNLKLKQPLLITMFKSYFRNVLCSNI